MTTLDRQSYLDFLERKQDFGALDGFAPLYMPSFLFDFQVSLVEWAIRKGRAAIFADCGLGKTPMQLVWAENIVRKTNKPVLILAPLAVGSQTVREGEKFGIKVHRSQEGEIRPGINITNYERLHYFSNLDLGGIACDESSILKHFSGATQKQVTRFMLKTPYRSLWTATAAPNDYIELGTSSEALGNLGYSDMLTRFFVMEDKKKTRMNDVKAWKSARVGDHYAKLAYRVSQQIGAWRMKGHAVEPFWRWVCSWARAIRKPSDLGFEDGAFLLPSLTETHHVIESRKPAEGMLFTVPAFGLKEEREERRRTLRERCEHVAKLVAHDQPAIVWCHLNDEGDLLEKLIPGAVQVAGRHTDEEKEAAAEAFLKGETRVLITKAKIFGFGMNFQHCAHVVTFASHSYEQYYQAIRRCWRFGQTKPVRVDIVSTVGEQYVAENMARKSENADKMFEQLVSRMNDALEVKRREVYNNVVEVPQWLNLVTSKSQNMSANGLKHE